MWSTGSANQSRIITYLMYNARRMIARGPREADKIHVRIRPVCIRFDLGMNHKLGLLLR